MPVELYSYKQGCRSTPKLRRNQSGWKYKNNPSVDSFTSLRPDSPGLVHTLPNSPFSTVSHESWSLSPRGQDGVPSPAYARFPTTHSPSVPLESIMSPLEPVTLSQIQALEPSSMFTELGSLPNSPADGRPSGPFTGIDESRGQNRLPPKVTVTRIEREDESLATAEAKHVLSLNLQPHQVALIRDAKHESRITQIYDWKGNEISYTFGGGMEQFVKQYERDEPYEIEQRKSLAPWKRVRGWGERVRKSFKNRGTRKYEVETWSRVLSKPVAF